MGYYKWFGSVFASQTLSRSLPQVTRLSQCNWAFCKIKQILCNEPILHGPYFSKQFIMQTDASLQATGAILSNRSKAMTTLSSLSHIETHSLVLEKECLAICWVLRAVRYYLLGTPFVLVTDHMMLRWFQTMKGSNACGSSRYLTLQPF